MFRNLALHSFLSRLRMVGGIALVGAFLFGGVGGLTVVRGQGADNCARFEAEALTPCTPSPSGRGGNVPVQGLDIDYTNILLKRAQDTADTLLITPTTQGTFTLPITGVTLEIAYATVFDTTHLTLTRAGDAWLIHATGADGVALTRFEMPLILHTEQGSQLIAWPGSVGAPVADRWLVVFDAHGIYALPADAPASESVLYVGPLEHYAPALLRHDLTWGTVAFEAAPPRDRAIIRTDGDHATYLPTAARTDHYRDRFIPEDLGNAGGFMLLGWTDEPGLVELAQALRGTLPADPDLPLPGVFDAPINLMLPFDCAEDWAVSWGYHHSTPQNRFAVDFAPRESGEFAVYAAHAGTVYLKRYGSPDQMIDIGLAARVIAADGVTSTVYGHLAAEGTLAYWDVADLPDFAWVEVGTVAPGALLGIMGHTGYATGPHIHVALWAWDQSLYLPVPFGPLTEFTRGQVITAAGRTNCTAYH